MQHSILHIAIYWICIVIGIAVLSMFIYLFIFHRRLLSAKSQTPCPHALTEWLWAIAPFILLAIMAVPAVKILARMHDDSQADLNIKITGYQWKWQYEYPAQGIHFFGDITAPTSKSAGYLPKINNPLVIPVHKKIRFIIISHRALPSFTHEAWARADKPGTYSGECAELCDRQHAFMPIVIIAKTQADFDQWVAKQGASAKSKNKTEPPVLG